MDSKTSTTRRPASTKTETAGVPRIPQEIIDEILGYLAADPYFPAVDSLRSCSLVSKSWVPPCRRHLFYAVSFSSRSMVRWLKAFPAPEESPSHHVRDLRALVGGRGRVPECFFEVTPWFTNVERVSLLELEGISLQAPSLWGLPPSVTSLTIKTKMFTLVEIRDLLARLPNLNDITLSGYFSVGGVPLGIGTILRGRFGGRLRILEGPAHEDTTNMFLEIPTGLRFTEVEIRCTHKLLLSTARLAEACSRTLVKLAYGIAIYGKHPLHLPVRLVPASVLMPPPNVDSAEAPERFFDFSEFPSLQEVEVEVGWAGGSLQWIPTALSTLGPTTSPRLSAIRLELISHCAINKTIEIIPKNAGSELRRVADELARIEREFGGAVKLTVRRNPGFNVVFDTLDVRASFLWSERHHGSLLVRFP